MNFSENSEPHYLLISALFLTSVIGIALTIWWMIPLRRSISTRSRKTSTYDLNCQHTNDIIIIINGFLIIHVFLDLSIFSSDSSAYENYTNSMRDTVSITDIDFGNMLEDNYSINDGVRNEVFNPALNSFNTETDSTKYQVPTVSIEEQSQSEV